MKKITLILSILLFTSSAFAGSCPMMAKGVDAKIKNKSTYIYIHTTKGKI